MRLNHNNKGKIIAPCAAALIAALWLLPVHAQDYAGGQQPAYEEPKPLSVPFNHNQHNKAAEITKCATCHHPLPGQKKVKSKMAGGRTGFEHRCSDCHRERPAPNEPASLMVVSHRVCQGCHNTRKKGPVKCSGCHKGQAEPQAQQQSSAGGNVLLPADGFFPALMAAPNAEAPAAPAQAGGNQTESK